MEILESLSNECIAYTSSEMLAILSSAKTHAIDIVQKWRLDTTLFPSLDKPNIQSNVTIEQRSRARRYIAVDRRGQQ